MSDATLGGGLPWSLQEPRRLRGAGARSWPVSPTCASVGGARAGEGLGSGPGLLRPGPSAARAFGGAGSPCRRERSFCTVPCRRQSPSDALVPGGGAAGDGRACPGCRQGPLSARARPFANARRDRAGGGRLRRRLDPGRSGADADATAGPQVRQGRGPGNGVGCGWKRGARRPEASRPHRGPVPAFTPVWGEREVAR